ncbi:MAG: sigma-54 dependent transcriptional regulator [Thiogranum sp.]|jgi:DNA-binding NtrC family response regulator
MTEVLLIDSDAEFTATTSDSMRHEGFAVRVANSMREARQEFARRLPQVLIMDWRLPDGCGLDLLNSAECRELRTVVVTDHPSVESAIESLHKRVSDYLIKPVDLRRLIASMRVPGLHRPATVSPGQQHNRCAHHAAGPGGLVGQTPVMRRVYGLLEKVAATKAMVLLSGESGTGKELAARAIHELSGVTGPFLAVNCAAISKDLIANELFGHEKGGYSGATGQHRGYFERAEQGTLLLDEITEMPLELQSYLLRVLETRKVLRVGGSREVSINVRLIAACNQPLATAVQQGRFREDLYYRLVVFPIRMPSLRERKPDIPLLVEHFLAAFNREHGAAKVFEEAVIEMLVGHHWPGNVRELRNCLQRAFLIAGDRISREDLRAALEFSLETIQSAHGHLHLPTGTSIREAERQLIMVTLEQCEGNKRLAAESLGVSLKTLYNKLKCYEPVFFDR